MPRILHTSDWHVGKSLGRVDRASDQRAALERVVEVAREARPDLVLHTGDVFDGPRPGHEEAELAVSALRELAALAPTVVLAGNHDSPALFRLFQTLVGDDGRLRFVGRGRRPDAGGIVDVPTPGGRRLRVAPLPFVHANRQVDWFGDPERFMGVYADRMRKMANLLHEGMLTGFDAGADVLVFAAHAFVGGAVKSGTERAVHVTDDYAIERTNLPGVSYVALGHIHMPQRLPGTPVAHYAGSVVPMDFGEAGERKSVVVVDADPGRPAHAEVVDLDAGRALVELRGGLDELAPRAPEVGDAIVRVTVESAEPVPDLGARVRDLLPRAEIVEVIEVAASHRLDALRPADAPEGEAEPTHEELFDAYLGAHGVRGAASAAGVRELFAAVRGERGADGRPDLPSLRALLEAELPPPPADLEAPAPATA